MKQDGEVWGLRSALVRDAEDVAKLLRIANAKRTVRSHKLNNVSSRSHYLFRMSVLGRNAKTQQTSEGHLNLVDLAGCALRLLACRCTPPRDRVLLPPLPLLLSQRALTALAAAAPTARSHRPCRPPSQVGATQEDVRVWRGTGRGHQHQ